MAGRAAQPPRAEGVPTTAQRVSPAASGGIRCYKSRADKGLEGGVFQSPVLPSRKRTISQGGSNEINSPRLKCPLLHFNNYHVVSVYRFLYHFSFQFPSFVLILRTAPSVTGRPLRWVNSAASSLSFRMPAFSRIYWRSFSDHFLFIMSCSVYNKVVICTIIL